MQRLCNLAAGLHRLAEKAVVADHHCSLHTGELFYCLKQGAITILLALFVVWLQA